MNKFTSKDVEIFWDSVADKYERTNNQVTRIHYQRFEQAIAYELEYTPRKILNVWARTGEGIPFLKSKYPNAEIISLEVSGNMIGLFNEKHPKMQIEKFDLNYIPFPDDYFDLVVSLETLEHAPNPDRFIKELNRVLKYQKNLVLSCPSAFSEVILIVYEMFFENHGEGPHKFLSSSEVKRKLKKFGFQLIEHRGFIMFPSFGMVSCFVNSVIETVCNAIGLSDLGIRQFYFAKKHEKVC